MLICQKIYGASSVAATGFVKSCNWIYLTPHVDMSENANGACVNMNLFKAPCSRMVSIRCDGPATVHLIYTMENGSMPLKNRCFFEE